MSTRIPSSLRWACRRGMLELDLWLGRFLEEAWPDLPASARATFAALLTAEDPLLYRWLSGQEIPPDFTQAALVQQIRDHGKN